MRRDAGLSTRSRIAAQQKPTTGEISSTRNTLPTCPQSTPEVPEEADMIWLAMPTPMMEPTMVCELDAGSPNHHVLRFQMIAAISRAKTMAKPAPALTFKISSTGSSVMTLKATAPVDISTPTRLHSPDHTTAMLGSSECV